MTYLLFIGVVLIALVGCAVVIGTGTATNTVDRKIELDATIKTQRTSNDPDPDRSPVPSPGVSDRGPAAKGDPRRGERSASAPRADRP